MDNQRWSQLRTLGHLNEEGCDLSLSTSVTYPGRELATLVTHCEVAMDCHAVITGTKGIIKVRRQSTETAAVYRRLRGLFISSVASFRSTTQTYSIVLNFALVVTACPHLKLS